MAKIGRNAPCPCGSGKKYKHCHLGKELPAEVVASQSLATTAPAGGSLVDANVPLAADDWDEDWDPALDDLTDEELDELLDEEIPLSPAEQLVDEAWDANRRWRRLELARQALDLDPNCVDAYMLLAHDARTHGMDPLESYAQAVAAGERALGADELGAARKHGDLWANPDSEAYRKARYYTAITLADRGQRDAAIDELRQLMQLDARDTMRAHVLLLPLLMHEDRDTEADELAARYASDPNTNWEVANGLRMFQRQGDTLFARRSLARAFKVIPELIPYFEGEKRAPEDLPVDDDIDTIYDPAFAASMTAWLQQPLYRQTPGATEWARAVAAAGEDAMLPTDPALIGNGPTFFLNTFDEQVYTTCPTCHGPTAKDVEHLAVLYEPDNMLVVKADCLACHRCDLLIADRRDVEDRMRRMSKRITPSPVGRDYIMVGTVPWQKLRTTHAHPADAAWIRETMVPFRGHMLYDREFQERTEHAAQEYIDAIAPAFESLSGDTDQWMVQ